MSESPKGMFSKEIHSIVEKEQMRLSESRSVMSDPLQPHGLYRPWNSPGQDTGVGSLSLLQGILPAQGSNPGLTHCSRILYQLSHQGSPNDTQSLSMTNAENKYQFHNNVNMFSTIKQ